MKVDLNNFMGDSPADNLKRVINDRKITEDIEKYIEEKILKNPQEVFAVVEMDMDKSKEIRKCGINIKLVILNEIYEWMQKNFTKGCEIFSHGTRDDITLVIEGDIDEKSLTSQVNLILKSLERKSFGKELSQGPFRVTYSAGISRYPINATNAADLIMLADGAVRRSKDLGGNQFLYADESFNYAIKAQVDEFRKLELEEISKRTGKTLQTLYREGLEELFEKHSALSRFCVLEGEQNETK